MLQLIESGRISTAPNAIQVVELLGSRELFDYADRNPRIAMKSSRFIHDPVWLARQPGLVSVCTALEVDLTGQVASEQVGGRTIAGVGGTADFFEGAHLSPGGVRVIALPALTPSGDSRIKRVLDPGTPVTVPRHSVDYVVTEHGVAHLTGKTVAERARAMADIAAPQHRVVLGGAA